MLARALTRRIAHSSLPPTLSTVYRRSMNGTAAVAKGLNSDGSLNKKALIPFSSRLLDGRALAQDVWSIYKYETLSKYIANASSNLCYMRDTVLLTCLQTVSTSDKAI